MGRRAEMSIPDANDRLTARLQSRRNRQPSIADREAGDRGAEDYDVLRPPFEHDGSHGRVKPVELDPRRLF